MNDKKSSGGIGFIGALQIAFIVMKLCDVIHWSWWLVLSPILISLVIVVICIIIIWIFSR